MYYKKSKETRDKIIQTTTDLFVTKGFEKTNIREIARQSDTSTTLIYYYFPNGKYGVGQYLYNNHLKKCTKILRQYNFDINYLTFLFLLSRFQIREIMTDEKEWNCYYHTWSQIYLMRPMLIETYTAVKEAGYDINIDILEKAFIISDSAWLGMYRAKYEGIKLFTHEEIRTTTDIMRWTYAGMKKEYIIDLIDQTDNLLKQIPFHNVRLFER